MKAVERLIATAISQIGYLEKATNNNLDNPTANAGYNNYTKYARDLDALGVYNYPKQGLAWCDMFVDWCFVKSFGVQDAWKITNQSMRGCGAGCDCSANYYKQVGRFFKTNPQRGDQIFFTNGKEIYHTGLVERVDSNRVYTIEGNTGSSAGVIANGGGVFRKSYPLNYAQIGGYGRPIWNLLDEKDYDEGDVDMITQEQFNEMMETYLQQKAKEEPSTWFKNDPAKAFVEANGIINGDATGNRSYKKFITREEAAAILYRGLQYVVKKYHG